MSKSKKILVIMLAIAMIVTLTPTMAFSEELSGNAGEGSVATTSDGLEVVIQNNNDGSEGTMPPAVRPSIKIISKSMTVKYDGALHIVEGFVQEDLKFELGGEYYTIEGLTAEGSGRDVGSYNNEIYNKDEYIVKDSTGADVGRPDFDIIFEEGVLTVTKRKVVMRSADKSKTYDGTALENGDTPIVISGDGFAENEGAMYTFTGSQTEVGSSPNSFEYRFRRPPIVNSLNPFNRMMRAPENFDYTNPDNYDIEKIEGTLTVMPYTSYATTYDAPTRRGTPSEPPTRIDDPKPPLAQDKEPDSQPVTDVKIDNEAVPTAAAPVAEKVVIQEKFVPKAAAMPDNRRRLPQTGQNFRLLELLIALGIISASIGFALRADARKRD